MAANETIDQPQHLSLHRTERRRARLEDFEMARAAIVGEIDAADGALVVLHSRNKVFAIAQLELVVDEWIAADRRRNPTIAVANWRDEKGAPRQPRLEPRWSPRTSR